ncbi:MAG: M20/M25/M40 family metallo-hydrolase [Saprospiraceae bacterium]
MKRLIGIIVFTASAFFAYTQDKVNEKINTIIRKQGMEKSKVMDIAFNLTDVYGPRLTGSDMTDKAVAWTVDKLKEMGMQNVHTEEWGPFGRGWELKHFEIHNESPSYYPIIAYPKAWTGSTSGQVTGEVIYVDASTDEEIAKYKGKLSGKIVLLDTIREVKEWFDPSATRLKSERLLEMANSNKPSPNMGRGNFPRNFANGNAFAGKIWGLINEEKPLAVLDRSVKGDEGTVFVSGARAKQGLRVQDKNAEVIPQVTVAIEQYNRILRQVQAGIPVKISLDLKTAYSNPEGMEYNIIAEIPGTDLKDEIVMFGAHFDSWHSATGATDNAAGSAVMIEAARILLETIKESGIPPRRTLRIALWTGEEQGLLGSRAYVNKHFITRDTSNNIIEIKPEQGKVSAYYNLDNGTGKIRGVYLQGNDLVTPVFRTWLDAFKDLDAATLTLQNTGGTDHLSFDGAGIPGFQFIQDEISYSNKTHHSNMDGFDHLLADDLKQASTIIASFIYHTAQRDEKLPRKPQPKIESH